MDETILIIVIMPVLIFLWFWVRHDIESKYNYVLRDKEGKIISRFGDWLDG